MKIMKVLLGSAMLAVLPLAAQAEDGGGMSYSYVDLNWVNVDVDDSSLGINESADGFGLRGSFGFAENFFGFAEYRTVEGDISGTDFDIDQLAVGLGGRYGISDNVDLVGRLGYTEVDVAVSGFGSADADGYLVSAGLRGELTDGFELEGHVIHTDLGSQGGDDTSFAVGGRYFFTENFAVDAGFESGDDLEIWHVGARFAF
jgi:hypothetical protein